MLTAIESRLDFLESCHECLRIAKNENVAALSIARYVREAGKPQLYLARA